MSYNSLIQPYMEHYYRQPCLEPQCGPCCRQEEVEIEVCTCRREKPCKKDRCCSPARQLPPQLECCEEECVQVKCCPERDCHCRKRRKSGCGCRRERKCCERKERCCKPKKKCCKCQIKVKVTDCEPKLPCDECCHPWVGGYPWITSTWYGRRDNCSYY